MSIDENAFTAARAAYWECNPDRLKSAIEAYVASAPWDKRPPKIRALSAPDTAQPVAAEREACIGELEASIRRHLEAKPYMRGDLKAIAFEVISGIRARGAEP